MRLISDNKILNPLKENNFNELRLIFSIIVMIFHIGEHSQVLDFHWMTFFSAKFAVQGFFVISGFLVLMSYINTKNLKIYFKKRFLRLAPAYIAVVILSAVLLSLLSTLSFENYFKSSKLYKYVFYNLALSNFSQSDLPGVFVNNLDQSVNGSLWTIKIEVAFYLMVPLLVFFTRCFNKNFILIIFFLSILWNLVFNVLAFHFNNELFLKLARQIPGQLSFFSGGILAYFYTLKFNPKPILSTILCIFSIILYFNTNGIINDIIAPFAVTIIVYWAAIILKPSYILNNKTDISYGLYLYHFPVIQAFVALGLFSLNPLGTLFLLTAVVIGISIFSWHFIERPFLHKI